MLTGWSAGGAHLPLRDDILHCGVWVIQALNFTDTTRAGLEFPGDERAGAEALGTHEALMEIARRRAE